MNKENYKKAHSKAIIDYVFSLKELPSEEEFVNQYSRLTSIKGNPSRKRKTGKRNYRFLLKYGL